MDQPIDVAIALMRMALALLDQLGETDAAIRLQHAIDIATRTPIPQWTEAMD